MTIELWYSPAFMLEAADLALHHCQAHGITPPAGLQKAIGEGRASALFAASFARMSDREVWLKLVDPKEQAPDARLMYVELVNGKHAKQTLDIEVASYTAHSADEGLADFMLRTKLTGHNAYSKHTVFVFYVLNGVEPDQFLEVRDKLAEKRFPGVAFLVGRAADDLFQVMQAYPTLSAQVDVSLPDLLSSSQTPVLEAKRGMSTIQRRSEKPISTDNPYLALL